MHLTFKKWKSLLLLLGKALDRWFFPKTFLLEVLEIEALQLETMSNVFMSAIYLLSNIRKESFNVWKHIVKIGYKFPLEQHWNNRSSHSVFEENLSITRSSKHSNVLFLGNILQWFIKLVKWFITMKIFCHKIFFFQVGFLF